MTPNFALGLTDDGITLWYKDTAGWLRVGAVAVDSPALDTEMSGLAKIAAALAPKGVATKLVIPDAQILFTSLQLPPLPAPEKERAIRAALVGRTPYPVEDLVFDWCDTDAQTHIAVTARETVIEAEDFANTYGLNPVSAVAAPMGKDFAQEPFFCITRTGRSLYPGQEAALSLRDMLREVGIAQLPDPEVIIPKLSEPAPPPAAPKDATSLAPQAEGSATQAVAKASLPEAKAPDMPKAEAAQPETTAPLAATSAAPIAEPSKTPTSTTELTPPQTPPKAAAPKRTPPAAAAEAFAAPILKTSPAAAPIAEPAATFRSRRVSAAVQDKSKRGSKTGPVLPALPQLPPYLRDLRKRATDGKAELGNVLAKLPAFAKQFTVPKRASAPTPKPTPDDSATRAVPAPTAPARKDAFATLRERGTTKPKANKPKDSEAERLTIFGARNQQIPPSNKAQNALLILGGVSLLLVAVAVWAVYFYARDDMSEIAAPAPTESIIAAPAPELAPDDSIRAIDDIEAALGLEDAAQQLPDDRPELSAQSTGQMDRPVPFAAQDLQGGRAAGLRSVGVIAPRPDAPLPISPAAPPAFAELSQAPLRSELLALEALPEAAASADGLPVENGEALAADTPGEQEQIEIEVIAGTPAAIPPQRPAGLIPEDVLAEITAQAEASPPDAQAQAEAQAETPPVLATVATPDETELVIGVTQGRPRAVPPPRPAALAPAAPSTAPTTDAAPDAIEDGNLTSPAEDTATTAQASLASPGGIALSALRPQARPEPLGQTPEAEPTPDAFATATRLAVPRSLRPDARPSQFAAIVERNLAARQVAAAPAAAPAPEPVQTARAAVAAVPAIPTSASVAREATQARAINLRQINLIGVMGTASNRRALVRLSNGNVVAVRVGEALDGGQVTAIGDSELRYIRRGRDVVLRLAS